MRQLEHLRIRVSAQHQRHRHRHRILILIPILINIIPSACPLFESQKGHALSTLSALQPRTTPPQPLAPFISFYGRSLDRSQFNRLIVIESQSSHSIHHDRNSFTFPTQFSSCFRIRMQFYMSFSNGFSCQI